MTNNPNNETGQVRQAPATKIRTGDQFFYFLMAATVLLVAVAFLPILLGNDAFLSGPFFQNLIAAGVSFLIAAFLFGLLGDSSARITGTGPLGLGVQVGGSAAGFVVFFLIITYGLSSNASLSVTLVDQGGQLLIADGMAIIVDQQPRQQMSVSGGRADFAYLPKGKVIPVQLDPPIYSITKIDPSSCEEIGALQRTIKADCNAIRLVVERRPVSIEEYRFLLDDPEDFQAVLRDVLNTARGRLQDYVSKNPQQEIVELKFSAGAERIAEERFPLNRRYAQPVATCSMLYDVVSAFNRAHATTKVGIAVVGNTIAVFLQSEGTEETGERKCLVT